MKATTFGGFLGTILVCAISHAATISTVPVGNAGNPADTRYDATGFGSVGYDYDIGKYEVTNAQYVEFLNSVDPSGANSLALYINIMSSDARGGINFNGGAANGSKYEIKPGRDNNPVVFVSWYDSIRFANWLHNGQGSGDTENGAYTLVGGTPTPSNGLSITRNPGATWFLPSEDEWYKAAYHKNDGVTGNYWDYPTSTDAVPYSDQPPGSDAPTQTNTANWWNDDGSANGYDDGYAVTGTEMFDDAQNYLTDVGAYTLSTSPYGTLIKFRTIDQITIEGRDPYIYTHPFGFMSIGTRRVEFTQAYPGSALPFSAVVIPVLVLASIPWIPWRFSLRTLLIATTLIAVGLGVVVYLAG